MLGAIASGIGSLIGPIAGLLGAHKQYKQNRRDIMNTGQYTANPAAGQELALAQNLYNGRMGGAVNEEQNILGNEANTAAALEANGTDASQVAAILAGVHGQTNQAFSDLAGKEAQDRINKAGLVFKGQDAVINEGTKEWEDKLRKLQMIIGNRSVKTQNNYNAAQGIGSSLSLFGNMYDQGYFKKG